MDGEPYALFQVKQNEKRTLHLIVNYMHECMKASDQTNQTSQEKEKEEEELLTTTEKFTYTYFIILCVCAYVSSFF